MIYRCEWTGGFHPFETYFSPVNRGSLNLLAAVLCFRAGTYSHEQSAIPLTTLGEFRSSMPRDFRLYHNCVRYWVPYVVLICSFGCVVLVFSVLYKRVGCSCAYSSSRCSLVGK
jgi:hypothetical protein